MKRRKDKDSKCTVDESLYPKVMVAIPTNNEKSYCLGPFLQGLHNLTYPNQRIVFTDDSVDNGNMMMLSGAGFEVYDVESTRGDEDWRQRVCNARNLLRKKFLESDCEYLFFLDSDVIPPPSAIQDLLAVFKANPTCNMACGIYFFHSHERTVPVAFPYFAPDFKHLHSLFANYETHPINPKCPEYINLFPSRVMRINSSGMGCNLLSRETVIKYGEFYYKPEYISTEDLWYCLDINKSGGEIWADTGCICIHYPSDKTHYAPGVLEKY